jgi:hypothetical protein
MTMAYSYRCLTSRSTRCMVNGSKLVKYHVVLRIFRQPPWRPRSGLGLQPRGVEKLDERERQHDQQKQHPGHQHHDGKQPAQIGVKGDVTEA